ncbi:ribosome biogenesis GTP-binding protein YihA/YsxC [Bartonella sp. TP]|uniref:ribosome biogenesis GTP-binding protein YihA/YsxC n=1 Tax=Bartonella sp. TP TaxID=3057550 RepID=UPI0025AF5EE6|nr:ribosome biogenesis GTP-binding protein YihA/YsxC [Bartonella sp. TP]MDN5249119.1 ribosome biogenesis GTP-binding protein YihA/YsxC [Alphaproteobacteria bacterium]WJW79673.1 ribosome biogenesis GTP-binding protein YihA/YsxC [Bartonella sp. TP]
MQNGFPLKWVFLRSAPSINFLPPIGPAEIAFCGRSNVGKSSLINSITNRKSLARTSNTPGRTQELNFFIPDGYSESGALPPFAIVDMPGYGYAQAPKQLVNNWTTLIYDYLKFRPSLKRLYILIDSRHGIKETDKTILNLLDKIAVSYQIILTKADKIPVTSLEKIVDSTYNAIAKRPAAYPQLITTSAVKKIGLDEIKTAIMETVK